MILFDIQKFIQKGLPLEICWIIDKYRKLINFIEAKELLEKKYLPVEEICFINEVYMVMNDKLTIIKMQNRIKYIMAYASGNSKTISFKDLE